MEMAQENPALARVQIRIHRRFGAETRELTRRHDEEKLAARFGHHGEISGCLRSRQGEGTVTRFFSSSGRKNSPGKLGGMVGRVSMTGRAGVPFHSTMPHL